MQTPTTEQLRETLTTLQDSFDQELFSKSKEQLEDYWFFKYDFRKSIEINMYNFYDMLTIYENQCERWEQHHNGHVCIVERVRDNYLTPKIKEFTSCIKMYINPWHYILKKLKNLLLASK